MKVDKNYFPGWVRKSVSFTIDDGNLETDRKFIDIVSPFGIKGTFNLSDFYFDKLSPEGYRELYRGFEIANHVRLHPFAFSDGAEYSVKNTPRPEDGGEEYAVYPTAEEGVCDLKLTRGWRKIADNDAYIRLTRECTAQIESVFGKKERMGFVWPFGRQKNAELFERLKGEGFYAIRITGNVGDKTGFALPSDRTAWSYNADNVTLLEYARRFSAYPDGGELKTFIFGVHSADFERSENWCDLEAFARELGGRPETYWYATNAEIFEYGDAVARLVKTDKKVENPSDITLYITIDGERATLPPHSKFEI